MKEIDDNLGWLLAKLDSLVVFMSDHGEMRFGMGSKMVFYEESVRVPLMMRLPGRIGARSCPLVEGRKSSIPDYRVSEWAGANVPNFMVRTGEWKLMMAKDTASRATDALLDLKSDPSETHNLLWKPGDRRKHAAPGKEMKDRLLEWLARAGSPLETSGRQRRVG
ncbi:MAG: sulfatase-like hydrolase/transferase [Bryobacterales bacterium]|nr:sulfatase-like hydrolase/transferase [Bryobacterales bacterium]